MIVRYHLNFRYFGVPQTRRNGKRSGKSKDFVRSSTDNPEVFLSVECVWTSSPSETYYKVSLFCRFFMSSKVLSGTMVFYRNKKNSLFA